MSTHELSPSEIQPDKAPAQAPPFIQADPELRAAFQRGIDKAMQYIDHPETQVMPTQALIGQETNTTPKTTERAVLGSRARTDAPLPTAGSAQVSNTFGNPEGRSPSGLERQQAIMRADYNSTRQTLEGRKKR